MSQFNPTRSEIGKVKYMAQKCEQLMRRAFLSDDKQGKAFWLGDAELYSANAFALSHQIAARDRA